MRDEAHRRIGHLYPKVTLPKEQGGGQATVIAWLWARTVRCPNPACGAQMPLVRSFALSTKPGKQAWVEPVIDKAAKTVRFEVRTGEPNSSAVLNISLGTGIAKESSGRGGTNAPGKVTKVQATFRCPVCQSGIAKGDYIDAEANEGRMGSAPLAIVAEGARGRVYLPFDQEHVAAARDRLDPMLKSARDQGKLPTEAARGTFASNAQGRIYGFKTFADYFAPRQLVALTTFSDLVGEARERALAGATAAGLPGDGVPLDKGGRGAAVYADAVGTYLALGVSRLSDIGNALCQWESSKTQVRHLFTRQAIPMLWDFAEPNIFAEAAGDFGVSLGNLLKALEATPSIGIGSAHQSDATRNSGVFQPLVSTDPPYYDNIGYADLSDFFYVWLRRSLGTTYPSLFSTLLVPKAQELVATPYRFDGSKEKAQQFFEHGLGRAFTSMRGAQHPDYPLTVYYAFKQAETDEDDNESGAATLVASTGWETMLEALLKAGFSITGTWPMRSELSNRMLASGTNALASSIVLVCRPRPTDAPTTSRRDFLAALRRELPSALVTLQRGNVAPVDFAQAAIGPGMAVFSRYAKVLESDGSPMRVRTALQLINQELDAYLTALEGDLEAGTRFCIAWFETFGMREAAFGEADVLARAKNTSVANLQGVLTSKGGKVSLLKREEYPEDWLPQHFRNTFTWAATQQLIRRLLDKRQGEEGAADLAAVLGSEHAEAALALAYRLYAICDRKRWSEEALPYNTLVLSWPDIQTKAALIAARGRVQAGMGLGG